MATKSKKRAPIKVGSRVVFCSSHRRNGLAEHPEKVTALGAGRSLSLLVEFGGALGSIPFASVLPVQAGRSEGWR